MQIFPKEIIDSTVEAHHFKLRNRSKMIYGLVLLGILGFLLSLPFIYVDVYTTSRGIIKPEVERAQLTLINSGKVTYKNMGNNQRVEKGDTLLVLNNEQIDDKLSLYRQQIRDNRSFVHDLSLLSEGGDIAPSRLSSPKYKAGYIEYRQKISELETRLETTRKDFERHKRLHDRRVISNAEFEAKKLEYDMAGSDLQSYRTQQQYQWQSEQTSLANTLKELGSDYNQYASNNRNYVLTAPVSGTLLRVAGIEEGGYINSGVNIGEISPDTGLLIECYITPSDIGLVRESQAVTYQIDAFNYNQWGFATGQIVSIGNDIENIDEETAVFKVRCSINEKYLQLKNGFRGNLGKGMTLTANFKLTERSLFDLLYDKVDDWLNPSRALTNN
ncbi:HlyD family secretion protein [Sinomicrobium soli]|uniref:HlyD family secretion protein n=1 Tax=Sinomicrobium sp. N-1-3-6 TaxID=2219864 RepID=UPI000DCE2A17|nr:HlyD family efflux transporter periplasmic adaptor subunit [Sinomicrobium sp. N-1-3-6]RAV29508.1 secretion protein HlyD [Sinomicrobium sp. N-1-3-6]